MASSVAPDDPEPMYGTRDWQTWAALAVFAALWAELAGAGRVRGVRRVWPHGIGRTPTAVAGACAAVALGIVSPAQAAAAQRATTIVTLAGLMLGLGVLAAPVRRATAALLLRPHWLPGRRHRGTTSIPARTLLARVSLAAGVAGALCMNDGAALFMSHSIAGVCRSAGLDPRPFAMAIATSANLGSAGLVLGNPKILVVAAEHGISFGSYFAAMILPTILALALNTLFVCIYFRRDLSGRKVDVAPCNKDDNEEEDNDDGSMDTDTAREGHTPLLRHHTLELSEETPGAALRKELDAILPPLRIQLNHSNNNRAQETRLAPLKLYDHFVDYEERQRHVSGYRQQQQRRLVQHQINVEARGAAHLAIPPEHPPDVGQQAPPWYRRITRQHVNSAVFAVAVVGMYVALFMRADVGFTVLGTAVFMVLARHFLLHPSTSPTAALTEPINWALLGYLFGLFVVVAALEATAMRTWSAAAVRTVLDAPLPPLVTALAFAFAILAMCVAFTSVPVAVVVAPLLEGRGRYWWLLLCWALSVCGNVAPFGSIAGLIVSEIFGPVAPHTPAIREDEQSHDASSLSSATAGTLAECSSSGPTTDSDAQGPTICAEPPDHPVPPSPPPVHALESDAGASETKEDQGNDSMPAYFTLGPWLAFAGWSTALHLALGTVVLAWIVGDL